MQDTNVNLSVGLEIPQGKKKWRGETWTKSSLSSETPVQTDINHTRIEWRLFWVLRASSFRRAPCSTGESKNYTIYYFFFFFPFFLPTTASLWLSSISPHKYTWMAIHMLLYLLFEIIMPSFRSRFTCSASLAVVSVPTVWATPCDPSRLVPGAIVKAIIIATTTCYTM